MVRLIAPPPANSLERIWRGDAYAAQMTRNQPESSDPNRHACPPRRATTAFVRHTEPTATVQNHCLVISGSGVRNPDGARQSPFSRPVGSGSSFIHRLWSPTRMWSPSARFALVRIRSTLHLDTVGRPQIRDKETGSGVDDDGVVAADVVIVENDVVVSKASDPDGRGLKRKVASGGVAQPGDDGLAAEGSAPFEIADGVGGRALGGPPGVQGLLMHDSCVQSTDRGPDRLMSAGVPVPGLARRRSQSMG